MSRVQPQEVEAILGDGTGEPRRVEPRDFRRPRRLGERRRETLERSVEGVLEGLAGRLGALLGEGVGLELAGLGEASAEGLLDGLDEPLAALRFDVAGEPGWLVWESAAAVAVVEGLLGAPAGAGSAEGDDARPLSSVEALLLLEVLRPVAEELGRALGRTPSEPRVAQTARQLGSWRDGGVDADPHRLEVELSVRGAAGESTLRAFLPGFRADETRGPAPADAGAEPPAALPAHVRAVAVELRVELGSSEVPLAQLLELEEGDVVPLDTRAGDPVEVTVAGRRFGRARLGAHGRRLAIRLERTDEEEGT